MPHVQTVMVFSMAIVVVGLSTLVIIGVCYLAVKLDEWINTDK